MSKECPLYPSLTEEGEKEFQAVMDRFKKKVKTVIDDCLSELYTDAGMYIESDAWTNFRNEIMDGYSNYNNRKIQAEYDFKTIRQAILKEHPEELVHDLNQDLLEEIESLKKTIKYFQETR